MIHIDIDTAEIGKNVGTTIPLVGDAAAVLAQLCEFVPTLGWRVRALDFSPVCGGDGNLEFLADLVPSNDTAQPFVNRVEIRRLVAQAHREIR